MFYNTPFRGQEPKLEFEGNSFILSNLFCKIFRFHNSKKAVMNFAKYIVAYNLAKFEYFAKQTLFLDSPARKLFSSIFLNRYFCEYKSYCTLTFFF